jgi:antitoxin CptB
MAVFTGSPASAGDDVTSSSWIASPSTRKDANLFGLMTIVYRIAICVAPGPSGLSALRNFGKMSGSALSSDGLDLRRKRVLYRAWHRGTREMDLILGRFADSEIGNLSDAELGELERLLEVNDPDLYAAITGDKVLPADVTGALFARIRAFPIAERDA